MNKFEKTTKIKCHIEDLFNFHLDTSNLIKITPKNMKVKILNSNFKARENEVVVIKTTKFFITMFWEVKIIKLEEPNLLVDLAIKSPFKYWRHQHIFTTTKDGCTMKDIIEFKLPFGFLGNIFSFLIKKDLNNMFTYRHKKTKNILEQ